MQAPILLRSTLDLLATTPTVGGLMALCEENYDALQRLAPTLRELTGRRLSHPATQAALLIEVLEQAPYTTTLRLTHVFDPARASPCGPNRPEPDAVLRAYHDAGQVEVLDLRQTALPVDTSYHPPALAMKWKANLFLSKWLGYCLREGHHFHDRPRCTGASPTQGALLPTA